MSYINSISAANQAAHINAQVNKSDSQSLNTQPANTWDSSEAIWQQLGREYNIHNISHQERAELSQKLYDAGEITLLDHAMLSFDGDNGQLPGISFLTEPNGEGKFDLVDEYNARIEQDKLMNNQTNLVHNERILDILNHLEHAGNEPIDIVV